MDSSIVVVIIVCAVAFGLLIWLEAHARRKKRSEAVRESSEAADQTVKGG